MTESRATGTAPSAENSISRGGLATSPPPPAARRSGWTGGRIAALIVGALLVLVSIGLFGTGGTALWADLARRDPAGYVTTGQHHFSTPGSALVTESAELDSPGVGWLYSSVVLGDVRIRVSPTDPNSAVFVGIARSNDVETYLAGVSHTLIADFWTERTQTEAGGTPASAPETRDFWAAAASGTGTQTVAWDATDGSWTVVVMDPDGRPGVDVSADLTATFPALRSIAIVSLVFAGIFLIGGIVLLIGASRRIRGVTTDTG